jgi:hypothetical protein
MIMPGVRCCGKLVGQLGWPFPRDPKRSDLAGWAEYGVLRQPFALVPGPAAAPGVHPAGPARRIRLVGLRPLTSELII